MTLLRVVVAVLALALLGGLNYFLYRRLVHDVTSSARLRRLGAGTMVAMTLLLPASRLLGVGHPLARTVGLVVLGWWGLCLFTLFALVVMELIRVAYRLPTAATAVQAEADDTTTTTKQASLGAPLAALEELGGLPVPALPVSAGVAAVLVSDASRASSSGAEPVTRRRFVAQASAAGALLFGGGMSAFGAWRAFSPPEVTELALRLRGLPKAMEGFTLIQLSDLHIGPLIQERFVDRLVAQVNALDPDLVAITGDLVDGSPSQLGRFVARLGALRSRYGTSFVSGNHDYYSGWERWAPVLTSQGITVLRNRAVAIGEPGASFDLVGVDDWGSRYGRHGYDLDRATEGRDPDRASVLLAHQPNGLELAAGKGLGLQLSGHTHGGQIFPGNLVGEVIWGERNAGLSSYRDTLLYTSRGCGFVGPPMRVSAPPEIVKLVLLPG